MSAKFVESPERPAQPVRPASNSAIGLRLMKNWFPFRLWVRAGTIAWVAWLFSRGIAGSPPEPRRAEDRLRSTSTTANQFDERRPASQTSGNPGARGSLSTPPSRATIPSNAKLLDPLQIEQDLREAPTVKVIVNLAPEAPTQGSIVRRRLRLAPHEIARIQREVIEKLPARDLALRARFDNIPGFSAEVTTTGLKALQDDPRVLSIEPVYTIEPHLAQGIPLIGGSQFRSTHNGAGVAIAVCDTGVDYDHPRLGGGGFPNAKVIGGYDVGDDDPDPHPNTQPHGTSCAGIAAGDLGAVGDYIGGVAYNAKLYSLKISKGSTTVATSDALVAAWDWCVTHQYDDPDYPILVISTSFGGGRFSAACDTDVPSLTAAAENAVAAGITVLASSGNNGYCDSITWPACISNVIAVGAVYDAPFGGFLTCVDAASCASKLPNAGCVSGWYCDDPTDGDLAASYGNTAHMLGWLAPANRCHTLDITGAAGYSAGDYFESFGGTSAACPYAAGAVACLQSAALAMRGQYLAVSEARDLLTANGDPVMDAKAGLIKPRLNVAAAIESISGNGVLTISDIPDVASPASSGSLTVPFTLNDGQSSASTPSSSLRLSASSSDPVLVPESGIHFGGAGAARTVTLTPAAHQSGVSTITVTASDGPYFATDTFVLTVRAVVLGRHIFYNQSAFDGNDSTANASDDLAIAVDKTALRPGETATFSNYTSYHRGINGIMVDIDGLPGTPQATDFGFKVSDNKTVPGWSAAPRPASVTTRADAGANGSSRVTLVWGNNVIEGQWLQVVVKSDPFVTGLTADDVFYFGNAIAEVGNTPLDAKVNATDEIFTRHNPRSNGMAEITFPYDFNRDTKVNATDQIIARHNQTSSVSALKLIAAP